MKQYAQKIISRSTSLILEGLAVVAVCFLLVLGVLVWMLASGPVDITFARDHIEQALRDPANDYDVRFSKAAVEWPDFQGPLILSVDGIELYRADRKILDVENVSLGLYTPGLFIGRIKPQTITLERSTVHLLRTEDNRFLLSLNEYDSAPVEEVDHDDMALMTILETLSKPVQELESTSPLSHLNSIAINDARLLIEDYNMGITWFMSPIDMTFRRETEGLAVAVKADMPGAPEKQAHLEVDLSYHRTDETIHAALNLTNFDPRPLAHKIDTLSFLNDHEIVLNGRINATLDHELNPADIVVDLVAKDGTLMLDGVYDAPFPYDSLMLQARYDHAAQYLGLSRFAIGAGGIMLDLASDVRPNGDGFTAPVKIGIASLPQEKIAPLWPDVMRGDGSEIWLTENLSGGTFSDIAARFDLTVARTSDADGDQLSVDLSGVEASFKVHDMDIDYRNPLAPVRGASGAGVFADDTLTIDVTKGTLKNMAVEKGRVVLDRIVEGGGMAAITVSLKGPLQDVFHYIAREPIEMTQEDIGIDVDQVRGDATLDIDVSFPTIRDLLAEQVIVKVDGSLGSVVLPNIVRDLDLTGGPLRLRVEDGAAILAGQALLGGRPIDFNWKQFLESEGRAFSSQVQAKLETDDSLRARLGVDLEDWITGTVPIDVTYTEFGGGRAEADIKADLTPAVLTVQPLRHVEGAGTEGRGSAKAIFRNGYITEVRDLEITTPQTRLRDARLAFVVEGGGSTLRRGTIPVFTLDENEFRIEFETAPSGLLKLGITGAFLDARPFLGKGERREGAYDGPPIIASVNVNRMRTHDARIIDRAKIYLDLDRQGLLNQLEMDAVAGRGDIYLRLRPDDRGKLVFRLEADDAGATLRAFDMYENIQGGRLVIQGESINVDRPRVLSGVAEMLDFRVVNAPALARLVSAISPAGLPQLLGAEGIYFARLQADFGWHIRQGGDLYVVRDGRTSGSSLGLTFSGEIDNRAQTIAINGTVAPMSMINEMIGSIPLIGDILTGGRGGGVIAATYEIEGDTKSPTVRVNPLAALTPGILRRMLFEAD